MTKTFLKLEALKIAEKRDLQLIPWIGLSFAQDLVDLGIHRVTDLRRRCPDRMYRQLGALRGVRIDRCALYVFRCAVYFASDLPHDPERLKWWNWKENKTVLSAV